MNSLFSLFFCTFLLCSITFAQSPYKADDIPKSLTENADAVIRLDKRVLSIERTDRVRIKTTKAVTVLNKSGDSHGYILIPYDDELEKAKITEGRVYDSKGKLIEKLKKSDIEDNNYPHEGITSTRYLAASLKQSRHPYTVVFSYEKVIAGLMYFPAWTPQLSNMVSVQKAELSIHVPKDLNLIYHPINTDVAPESKDSGGNIEYVWQISNLPAVESEPLQPKWNEISPVVYLNTNKVSAGGIDGSMDSWESFGGLFYQLNKDRDELPEALAEEVKKMTAGIEDPYEKIAKLYKYVQDNTRYVSIQLGIGGWQTFEAKEVYENGYGDCKALSNYTKALLKYAGIPSYLTLVGAGEDQPPVQTGFTNNPFNHMILCIPVEKDTVWLECTSPINPTGYLGLFTENRHVLVLAPEGGKLVRTPSSTPEMNQQIRVADVFLDKNGNAKVKVAETATGDRQMGIRRRAELGSEKEKEDWMKRRIDAGSFSLGEFEMKPLKGAKIPTCELTYEIQAHQLGGEVWLPHFSFS